MKIVWFVHAVGSCWNNGNAHFLRGLGVALQELGHQVRFCEPRESWSEENLLRDHGAPALAQARRAFPTLHIEKYDPDCAELEALTDGADLVIVHEWNPAPLVAALGRMRAHGAGFTLLFHDTHHRAVTDPGMAMFDLSGFDGVLAFGEAVAEIYRRRGWARRVWTLHEAADTATFYPRQDEPQHDLVWIGNWGDEERSAELAQFLFAPAGALRLGGDIFGVRYPQNALEAVMRAGLSYRGWLANHRAPGAFARARFTVHVPRRPYAVALPGIPTIRVFEALACGIPLISAPWRDEEHLFPPGCYLTAADGAQMQRHMRALKQDAGLRQDLRERGLAVIAQRHTCRHRAQQVLDIAQQIHPLREVAA